MAQRRRQLLTVVGEELRIVRASRDGDVSHAAVEQIPGAQFRIHIDQNPFGGLPLAGMTRDRIAMIEMRMPLRIEPNFPAAVVHPQTQLSIPTDPLNRAQLAVSHFQVIGGRGELDAVRSPTDKARGSSR